MKPVKGFPGPLVNYVAVYTICSISLFAARAYNISPLYLPPAIGSRSWYGPDGMWSAVTLRVGNPPQQANVIPTTNTNDLWTVSPIGCNSEIWSQTDEQNLPPSCTQYRGGVFDTSKSSTWSNITSALGFSEQRFFDLGLNVTVNYGTDTVRIGIDDSLVLEDYLIANFADPTNFITGILGLSVANVTFDQQTTYKALLTTLYDQKKIPSQSWGYTAGAYYREKNIPCSVVLGGYDLDRFVLHDRFFTLSPDLYAIAGLQSINANSSSANNQTLLNDPIQIYIDSTTPYYHFPKSVCDRFADLFDLVYDFQTELYFYASSAAYESAKAADYLLSFTLTNNTDGSGDPVVLYLPFASFDLQHMVYNGTSSPDSGTPRPYFPIKRAAREDVYTLGRAFLQETYLIVDYYRVTFSIHQAWFNGNTGAFQNVVTITDPATDDTSAVTTGGRPAATSLAPGESGSHPNHLSDRGGEDGSNKGALIGGSVAGGIVVLLLIGLLGLFIMRRRKYIKAREIAEELNFFPSGANLADGMIKSPTGQETTPVELAGQTSPRYELASDKVIPPQELEAEVPVSAIPLKDTSELDGIAISTNLDPDIKDNISLVSFDKYGAESAQFTNHSGSHHGQADENERTVSSVSLAAEGTAHTPIHRHNYSQDGNSNKGAHI